MIGPSVQVEVVAKWRQYYRLLIMGMGFLNDGRIEKRNIIHFQLEIIYQDSKDQFIDPLNPTADSGSRSPTFPPENKAAIPPLSVNSIATSSETLPT